MEEQQEHLQELIKTLDEEVRHDTLLELSKYYLNKDGLHLSYMYSIACLNLKVPENEHNDIISYQRYLHHATVCDRINSVEEGIYHIKKALKSCNAESEKDKIAECRKVFENLLKNSKPI